MNSPEEFQAIFGRSIISGVYDKNLVNGIRPGGSLKNGNSALHVHEEGYYARLTDALGETYEAIWWVLGDEVFFQTARDFIKGHPSTSPNLSDYGFTFPEFLESTARFKTFPFLGDLAHFEWAFKNVFHELQHEPAQNAAIAQNSISEQTQFQFAPSVRLHHGEHSILPIWDLRSDANKPPELPDTTNSEHLFLYKSQSKIYVQALTPAEYQILDRLIQGESLGKALEESDDNVGVSPDTVQKLFHSLSESGVVVGLS